MEFPEYKEFKKERGMRMKRHGRTIYKYVQIISYDGNFAYRAEVAKFKLCKDFGNIRKAANAVDLSFIKAFENPPNNTLKSIINE